MDRQNDKIADTAVITEMTDAHGNVTELKQKKTMSKRDLKVKIKSVMKQIKNGEELNSDDEEFVGARMIFTNKLIESLSH